MDHDTTDIRDSVPAGYTHITTRRPGIVAHHAGIQYSRAFVGTERFGRLGYLPQFHGIVIADADVARFEEKQSKLQEKRDAKKTARKRRLDTREQNKTVIMDEVLSPCTSLHRQSMVDVYLAQLPPNRQMLSCTSRESMASFIDGRWHSARITELMDSTVADIKAELPGVKIPSKWRKLDLIKHAVMSHVWSLTQEELMQNERTFIMEEEVLRPVQTAWPELTWTNMPHGVARQRMHEYICGHIEGIDREWLKEKLQRHHFVARCDTTVGPYAERYVYCPFQWPSCDPFWVIGRDMVKTVLEFLTDSEVRDAIDTFESLAQAACTLSRRSLYQKTRQVADNGRLCRSCHYQLYALLCPNSFCAKCCSGCSRHRRRRG